MLAFVFIGIYNGKNMPFQVFFLENILFTTYFLVNL